MAAPLNSSSPERWPSRGEKQGAPKYVPNAGFLLFEGEKGQVYFRLFSYARYLNQRSLDPSYVDSFGVPHDIQQRQDMQLAKFFAPFSGWFLTPRIRYYLYVVLERLAGGSAQVVGAGNLSYSVNRYFTVGAGITSLPQSAAPRGSSRNRPASTTG